ncbi:DeoR/GlpR family DNA-binding transcription regulator [Pseudogemmobacter faecipullorum]|uniref:DeoR/GlpR transcriptional regulator n=1 Tax=Pseudogemmobacter faecipullorum TaxID=2755041 RepID=A0ABS8CPT6_9RHOB|nr:DeoR/GlpR family DNA-binding transcription regulator [Pseudogemmobacter faecipullorum]MCB5411402.1 DeoR/GlpR transcriptional regulator [Pseudogemmobacter faecipullorum]
MSDPRPQADLSSDVLPTDSRHARQIVRRQMIAEAVLAEGTIRIEDLTERFGISLMTAHRDLDELASRGLLRKTRGVVSAAPTPLVEASDAWRVTRQQDEKRAVAAAAAALIEPGQSAFFDDSTTVFEMAAHLPARVPLTAITNSLVLMNALKATPDISLLGLGGQFQPWCNAFMGPVTTTEIRRMRADLCFISMAAITDGQAFHQSPEMVEVKRAMFDSAARKILLADHSKFERRALHALCPLRDFDLVILDDGVPQRLISQLQQEKVPLLLVPCSRSAPRTPAIVLESEHF